jgi:preprotein translocase subunit SecE
MPVNRETKRMIQRQGQTEANGSPPDSGASADRGAVAVDGRPSRATRSAPARKRTSPSQFLREVRDELRQVAWPTRPELLNYTAVVLTTLIFMILLIFVLNLLFGKAIVWLFTK